MYDTDLVFYDFIPNPSLPPSYPPILLPTYLFSFYSLRSLYPSLPSPSSPTSIRKRPFPFPFLFLSLSHLQRNETKQNIDKISKFTDLPFPSLKKKPMRLQYLQYYIVLCSEKRRDEKRRKEKEKNKGKREKGKRKRERKREEGDGNNKRKKKT